MVSRAYRSFCRVPALLYAVLGFLQITHEPHILLAVLPGHAVRFFLVNKLHGFVVLGAVFLVVTGAEALYADMGHFGKRPKDSKR